MSEIPGPPTIPSGPPPNPAALLREWRWSAARGALTDPLFLATVLACAAAAAAVAGGWADALAGRAGLPLAALAVAAAGAAASAAAAGIAEVLLFRAAENALLLTLPLRDDDFFAARAAEARWWASPLALVLACAAAGAAGWPVGLAAGLAAGVAAPGLGFGAAATVRSRGHSIGAGIGAALALGAAPGLLVAALLPRPSPVLAAAAAAALTWAVGLGTMAAGRSAWRKGGRRAAAQPTAARPRGVAWRALSGLLAFLPAPVRVRVVRDVTLLLAGASPRALLTALLALSMLPFAARDFAAWDTGEGALAWHLQWFRWLTAGGAVLSFGWGLDVMEARAPGLVLERTAPHRATPTLWASAILAFAAVLAWGMALLAVASPGPPYGAGRLALESAVFAASLGHFAATFALQRFDGRRVSGAFAFLPGVLAIGVLVALALHVHPLAGLLYFTIAPGMGAQARAAWERLEVPG